MPKFKNTDTTTSTTLFNEEQNTTTTTFFDATQTVTENKQKIVNEFEDDFIEQIKKIKEDIIEEKNKFEDFIRIAPSKLEDAFTSLKEKILNDIITERTNSISEIKSLKEKASEFIKEDILETKISIGSMYRNFCRLKFDIISLLLILGTLYFIPNGMIPSDGSNPQSSEIVKFGLFWLFITKFLLVSAGIIHSHVTRKVLFNYIKFRDEKEWSNNAIIIALYLVIIYSWAHGG